MLRRVGGTARKSAFMRVRALPAPVVRMRASSLAPVAGTFGRTRSTAGACAAAVRLPHAHTSSWQEVNITRGGVNPLIDAVKHGDRERVFKIGSDRFTANVDGSDSSRVTALMYAAKNGDVLVARFLVHSLRADVRRRDADQSTALHYAAKFHHPTITQLLLEGGANPADADAWGRTPLHWAAMTGDTETCSLLCNAGAPLDARDKGGHTPLNVAANVDQLHICALIKQTQRDRAAAAAASPPPHTVTARNHTQSVTIGCYPDAHRLTPAPANAEREPTDLPHATTSVHHNGAAAYHGAAAHQGNGLQSMSSAAVMSAVAAAVEPVVVKAEAARAAWLKVQNSGNANSAGDSKIGRHYAPVHCDEPAHNAQPQASSERAMHDPRDGMQRGAADPRGSVERGWWCDDMNPQSHARSDSDAWDREMQAEADAEAEAEAEEDADADSYDAVRGRANDEAHNRQWNDSDEFAAVWDDIRSVKRSAEDADARIMTLEERIGELTDDLSLQSRRVDHLVVRLSRVTANERDSTDRSDDDLPRTPR